MSAPDIFSLRDEIALAQTNMCKFLSQCKGVLFTVDMHQHIMDHLENISRLKEKESKRIHQESVVQELLNRQALQEAAILEQVLNEYHDPDTAREIAVKCIDLLEENAGISANMTI